MTIKSGGTWVVLSVGVVSRFAAAEEDSDDELLGAGARGPGSFWLCCAGGRPPPRPKPNPNPNPSPGLLPDPPLPPPPPPPRPERSSLSRAGLRPRGVVGPRGVAAEAACAGNGNGRAPSSSSSSMSLPYNAR